MSQRPVVTDQEDEMKARKQERNGSPPTTDPRPHVRQHRPEHDERKAHPGITHHTQQYTEHPQRSPSQSSAARALDRLRRRGHLPALAEPRRAPRASLVLLALSPPAPARHRRRSRNDRGRLPHSRDPTSTAHRPTRAALATRRCSLALVPTRRPRNSRGRHVLLVSLLRATLCALVVLVVLRHLREDRLGVLRRRPR